MKRFLYIILAALVVMPMTAQESVVDSTVVDTTAIVVKKHKRKQKPQEVDSLGRKIKTGWNFGILPSIAYDADYGFQGGVLTNVYYYGDGKQYPEYIHSLYFEAWGQSSGCQQLLTCNPQAEAGCHPVLCTDSQFQALLLSDK